MSEDFQYRLAKKQYESFDILGLSYINLKHPNRITLWFNDRSSIVDKGTLITANGGTAQANAQRMVELARLKNWKRISFTGDNDFLREAFRQALAMNLEVVAEGEGQQALLNLIKAEAKPAVASSVINAEKSPVPNIPLPTKHKTKKGMRL